MRVLLLAITIMFTSCGDDDDDNDNDSIGPPGYGDLARIIHRPPILGLIMGC